MRRQRTFDTPGSTFRTDPSARMTVPYMSPSLTVRCTAAASSPSTLYRGPAGRILLDVATERARACVCVWGGGSTAARNLCSERDLGGVRREEGPTDESGEPELLNGHAVGMQGHIGAFVAREEDGLVLGEVDAEGPVSRTRETQSQNGLSATHGLRGALQKHIREHAPHARTDAQIQVRKRQLVPSEGCRVSIATDAFDVVVSACADPVRRQKRETYYINLDPR